MNNNPSFLSGNYIFNRDLHAIGLLIGGCDAWCNFFGDRFRCRGCFFSSLFRWFLGSFLGWLWSSFLSSLFRGFLSRFFGWLLSRFFGWLLGSLFRWFFGC